MKTKENSGERTNDCISNADCSKMPLEIKTFAFFDLETTGIPDLEFFKTKITELSIIACPVSQFLELPLPRVQHKLTLCFNPWKRISEKSTEITGLTNELLEHENKFDKNAMNLLESFLLQLQQPVCLIAHNGDKFDFPLLKKQHDILGGNLQLDLKCCDSLPIFRKIDEMNERKMELLKEPDVEDKSIISADNEMLQGISPLPKLEDQEDDKLTTQEPAIISGNIEILEKLTKPLRDRRNSIQVLNETTPDKPIHRQPHQAPLLFSTQTRPRSSKRELFPPTSSPTKKKKFTLGEIYYRFFDSYPMNAHDSEADCMTLLKSASFSGCKLDFARIVAETAVNFNDIKKF